MSTKFYTVTVDNTLSGEKELLTFNFLKSENVFLDTDVFGAVDINTVSLLVPNGTNVSALTPDITLSPGATISPRDGKPINFSLPVIFTVTAEDLTTMEYTVTVTVTVTNDFSGDNHILTYDFLDSENFDLEIDVFGTVDVNRVTLFVPNGTDISNLTPDITISPGATISPTDEVPQNFFGPVTYIVTAEDLSIKKYTIYVTIISIQGCDNQGGLFTYTTGDIDFKMACVPGGLQFRQGIDDKLLRV